MEQLNNVIDIQTMTDLEKELTSLKRYHENLNIKRT